MIVDISEEYTLTQPDIMSEDIKQSDIPSPLLGKRYREVSIDNNQQLKTIIDLQDIAVEDYVQENGE